MLSALYTAGLDRNKEPAHRRGQSIRRGRRTPGCRPLHSWPALRIVVRVLLWTWTLSLPASRRSATTAVATAKTTEASATAATTKSAEPSANASVGHGVRQERQPPEAANASARTTATAGSSAQNHDYHDREKDQLEDPDPYPSGASVFVFR